MADKKEEARAEKPEVIEAQANDPKAEAKPEVKEDTHEESAPVEAAPKPPKKSFKEWVKSKQGKMALAIIAGVILLVGILFAVPVTRYAIAGTFIRKDVSVSVVDNKTGKPISDAEVSVANASGKTDKDGKITLGQIPVGQYQLNVKKKHFKDLAVSVTVPILSAVNTGEVKLEATGRQVPITVTNKIGGQALGKVTITADDTTAITDDKGEAILVLPANATSVKATLKADGYNDQQVDVTVTEQADDKNKFSVTPSGKLYFLSRRSGKVDVMKANLDGSDAQVVLRGTGKESPDDTVLMASRDWKYLALKARRDSEAPKLYLINTSNEQLSVIDEGAAAFYPKAWSGHTLVFQVERSNVAYYQPRKTALKSFNGDTGKLVTLDETFAEGNQYSYRYEFLDNLHMLPKDDSILYTKQWYGPAPSIKQHVVITMQVNGSNKKVVKSFEPSLGLYYSVAFKPGEIYFESYQDGSHKYFSYKDGSVKQDTSIISSDFRKFYPSLILSASGEKAFWYEPRDGKKTLFIGNKFSDDAKEVGTLTEYKPYGWYGDEYLLVTKGNGELYIMPATNSDPGKAYKVTDYHRPSYETFSYGGGYGGF